MADKKTTVGELKRKVLLFREPEWRTSHTLEGLASRLEDSAKRLRENASDIEAIGQEVVEVMITNLYLANAFLVDVSDGIYAKIDSD
ncbi:MAG TPA: hypothetical protein PKM65_20535 [Spirochaetota bacterium]|nr:hypothetical protein [Spirochaetota bacterium]